MALDPSVVANAFVQKYYSVLTGSPDQVHNFYHDESILGRPDSDGKMESITTTRAIKEYYKSTYLWKCSMLLENIDAQPSQGGGLFIVVTGSFTTPAKREFRFAQSFFLAPQQNGGYFVMNDVLRYTRSEAETPSIKENMDAQQSFHQGNNVNNTAQNGTGYHEPGETGDEKLCVICLRERRKAAFVPCGHLVCCYNCAKKVKLKDESLCPLCRQDIHYVLRVYDS